MIAAECNGIPSSVGSGDTHGDGHRFTARASVTYHLGPWMDIAEQVGQIHLFRAVQGSHGTGIDGGVHGGVHLWIGIAEHTGANAAIAHVNILVPTEVPDLGPLGSTVIARPLLWQEHLRSLGEQLCAAGNTVPRVAIELLAGQLGSSHNRRSSLRDFAKPSLREAGVARGSSSGCRPSRLSTADIPNAV